MRLKPAFIVLFAVSTLGVFASCEAQPKVTIRTQTGQSLVFQVEVADTPSKRSFGLQYRKELAAERGMIFLFPSEEQQSFWMKNTPIPLDMIFINSGRKIVGIVEQTTPFSLDSRSVPAPSQFVLEINGGMARRHGIRPGDVVEFDGFSTAGIKE
jgi:uncharacterized membrane protein (UPF0127 family)